MTIGAQNRNDAVGNGTTATYPYQFKVFAATHLEVTVRNIATDEETTLTYPTHYSVTGVGVAAGGNVVLVNSAAFPWIDGSGFLETGYAISIRRTVPLTQSTDIRNQGNAYAPSVHENAFDYLTMIDQKQQDEIDRALRVGPSFADVDTLLPAPVAGAVLQWAADGLSIENGLDAGNLAVSAFGQSLLNAASAAAARTLLDVPTALEAILDSLIDAKGDLLVGTADNTVTRRGVGSDGDVLTGNSGASDGLVYTPQGAQLFNGTFVVTHNSPANGLTIALKRLGGSDPSPGNPVFVAMPNTSGGYIIYAITAAMSLAISSGSTLGTVSGQAHRIYFGLADDSGTLRLWVYNPWNNAALGLTGIIDGLTYSSTAEGGAGGADSARVLYSGTAFTSKVVRALGYFESSQTVAGTWTSAPTRVKVLAPGDLRTGDVVQDVLSEDGAFASSTTTMPFDNTTPQSTEGTEFQTMVITPLCACNVLRVRQRGNFRANTLHAGLTVALFRDAATSAFLTTYYNQSGAGYHSGPALGQVEALLPALATSASTFRVRAGQSAAGNTYFNGDNSGSAVLNGTAKSYIAGEEIFA